MDSDCVSGRLRKVFSWGCARCFDKPVLRGLFACMNVEEYIPHRPPFLFVDRVVSCSEDSIVAERTWRADEDFYKGHYPENPITPGVLLCESVFQTAAILMAHRAKTGVDGKTAGVPVLAKIGATRFRRIVKPGETAVMEVSLKESMGAFHFMHGKITVGGKAALNVEFSITMG